MSWGGSEKNRWFLTRRFDQYGLIVFLEKDYRRVLVGCFMVYVFRF